MSNAGPSYGIGRDVNPDAGWYAIANDPAERAAAEAATRRSWREFPYYAKRYGERGWRFSLSDGGFLTTLSDASEADAIAQTRWLGKLLAARGMPQMLLERHFTHLHAELIERRPAHAERYARLVQCSAALAELRRNAMPEESFTRLAGEFEMATATYRDRVPNMGTVLLAAVVDDRCGLEGVAANVGTWASDPGVFGEEWRTAVSATLAAADVA